MVKKLSPNVIVIIHVVPEVTVYPFKLLSYGLPHFRKLLCRN